jgi:branched-chain amino acid transport system substrate-binding protein
MTIGRLSAAIALGAAIGVASASCSGANAHMSSDTDTVYIGVAAARGSAAYFHGVELAVARLNAERPSASHPFGVRMPSMAQTSQVAIAARFRDDPAVIGVVGHTGSAQTLEAAPVYGDIANGGRHAVVAVTPTATNPQVTRITPWVFRICPTDDDAARALARFAADSLHLARVAIVYRNDLFGRGFARTILPELAAGHVEVLERDPYLADITEYRAYAARMARGGVDGVIFAGGGTDAADLVRALHNESTNPIILGSDDVASILDGVKAIVPNVPTHSRRRKKGPPLAPLPKDDRELFRGVRFTAFYDATRPSDPDARHFAAEYNRHFGQLPTPQAALSYDAAMLIGHAAIAVGPDRPRIREWIASVGAGAPPARGVSGAIRFDDHGNAVGKSIVIGRIEP